MSHIMFEYQGKKYPYDPTDEKSVLDYANALKGHSLKSIIEMFNEQQTNYDTQESFLPKISEELGGKGKFGQYLERDYFGQDLNSEARADFHEIGIELKSTPLKRLKNGTFRAKERLVLNIINYMTLVNEPDFLTSSFYTKNAYLLLIFYLHQSGVSAYDLQIHLVGIWKLIGEDLIMIEKDWLTIKEKIEQGNAHTLSEGDTFYLGACTKGANAKSLRQQPYSDIKAMQRAFSYKQSYVNHIIASIAGDKKKSYGKILDSLQVSTSIEDIIYSKFKKVIKNKTPTKELMEKYNVKQSAKNKYASVTKSLLGVDIHSEIEEFVKAGITIRTVRLDHNNTPKEQTSFPAFEFMDIYEQQWEDSDFYNQLSNKFLFVFLKDNGQGDYYYEKIKLWNMPVQDLEKVEVMFDRMKELIQEGTILHSISPEGKRKTNLPGKFFNNITHVRPHGGNAQDTFPLPVPLKVNQEMFYSKQCLWLNGDYVRDAIYFS
ncbi:Sau3AI family type II restriction endonuclease [Myroides sp. LJL115]